MKIGIVGAGAVGGFFGGLLKKSGHQVTFLARGKHLEAMKANGLHIKGEKEEFTVHSEFTDNVSDLRDSDWILFCIKSNSTRELAKELQRIIKEDAKVLTLQNGVDNEEVLSNIFGAERVFSSATYIQSTIEKPGVISQKGRVQLVIGELEETAKSDCSVIVNIFKKAGVDTRHTGKIMARKWSKLLWNITFNPLSAISTAAVGEILDDPDLRKTAEIICKEALDVATNVGIKLDRNQMFETIFKNAERARTHHTSMLQDRLNRKPMEVEAIIGYVKKKADELQINVPTIHAAYSILNYLNQQILEEKSNNNQMKNS